ncbi:hypothetical protein AVEN_47661-1 [Araneus ventricosus]|uniref:Uncharacterized protein n=1 Tax=Araneus ventricosus TaxID=182803 RepID=A0A4Y2HZ77_ARAVE|nr:hypothetical protein AVEN_47661-1 [Araneus ventricosus]
MSTSKVTRLQMHLLKQVLMMLQCLLHLSPTWSCSPELKAGIKLSGSFHRCITGIRVLDQVSVYQLIDCSRRDQTTLTRFLSGHIRSLTFADNSKCFEVCPKCAAEQATPDHILACLGLSQEDLVSNPLLTLDFFRVHRLMDLI